MAHISCWIGLDDSTPRGSAQCFSRWSASDAPLLEGVPSIPAGEKMGGRFFPLLFDRDHFIATQTQQ